MNNSEEIITETSELTTEEENIETSELTTEETHQEESTENVLEESTEDVLEESTENVLEESIEVSSEVGMETVIYTTDPMVVDCLQIIICFLGAFAIFGVCKFCYKCLDVIF